MKENECQEERECIDCTWKLIENRKSSKRLNRSGPNSLWNLTRPQGRFIDAKNYKKLFAKLFDFLIF